MILNSQEIDLISSDPLFKDISKSDISHLLYCLRCVKKEFPKDSFIFQEGDKADYAVFLLKGNVDLIRYDEDGNENIIESFRPGQSFGEAFAIKENSLFGVSALVKESATALFIFLRPLLSEMDCPFSQLLIKNLVVVLAEKDLLMNAKLNVLSKKGLRGKVMEYLSAYSHGKKNVFFKVPFSRQEMADYFGCDRSALSRLLSSMKEDGTIDFYKHQFCIK
jgi:CRP-like cAMP-binding protein